MSLIYHPPVQAPRRALPLVHRENISTTCPHCTCWAWIRQKEECDTSLVAKTERMAHHAYTSLQDMCHRGLVVSLLNCLLQFWFEPDFVPGFPEACSSTCLVSCLCQTPVLLSGHPSTVVEHSGAVLPVPVDLVAQPVCGYRLKVRESKWETQWNYK